jgi:hypothetical protein
MIAQPLDIRDKTASSNGSVTQRALVWRRTPSTIQCRFESCPSCRNMGRTRSFLPLFFILLYQGAMNQKIWTPTKNEQAWAVDEKSRSLEIAECEGTRHDRTNHEVQTRRACPVSLTKHELTMGIRERGEERRMRSKPKQVRMQGFDASKFARGV